METDLKSKPFFVRLPPRGLIYDRAGRLVAYNVPSYVVRIRPADLPLSQRPAVVTRLSALLGMPEREIIEAIDRNAGLLFDPVRIATDVPIDVARIIDEEAQGLPGVQVHVIGPSRDPAHLKRMDPPLSAGWLTAQASAAWPKWRVSARDSR